jgi:hypothetical protein
MAESQLPYTRRQVRALTPEILGHYHDLVMANDFEGFKMLLEIYRVPEELQEELCHDFKHYAEMILRRRWRGLR